MIHRCTERDAGVSYKWTRTHQRPRYGNAVVRWVERWLPQPRSPRQLLCLEPVRTAHLPPHAGYFQLENTATGYGEQRGSEVQELRLWGVSHTQNLVRRSTWTKSGMVLSPLMTILLWTSRARMCRAPVQPSTISSIRTPSWCVEVSERKGNLNTQKLVKVKIRKA